METYLIIYEDGVYVVLVSYEGYVYIDPIGLQKGGSNEISQVRNLANLNERQKIVTENFHKRSYIAYEMSESDEMGYLMVLRFRQIGTGLFSD